VGRLPTGARCVDHRAQASARIVVAHQRLADERRVGA
jgi:hypothetical protein